MKYVISPSYPSPSDGAIVPAKSHSAKSFAAAGMKMAAAVTRIPDPPGFHRNRA
jgi:hypothetical protein